MKSKLVALLTCKLCKLEFMMDLKFNIKLNTGLFLSNFKCMNCTNDVEIDIMRVQR